MHDHRQSAGEPTLALLMPARLAIRIAQLFSCEQPLSGQYDMDGIVECRAQQPSSTSLIRPARRFRQTDACSASRTISRPRWRLHLGAVRTMQATKRGRDSLETNFKATCTCFAATAHATLDPSAVRPPCLRI